MELPQEPMAPITNDTLPSGDDWGYQLKWDGVRILAAIENGKTELYSRKLLSRTTVYPEVAENLTRTVRGTYLLDGEAVVFDEVKQRPVFQKVMLRERSASGLAVARREPVTYVLFDLLYADGEDLRQLPYADRLSRLQKLFPEKRPTLFITDLFLNGEALWEWVRANNWEGVVSKRMSSTYKEGKKHGDWFKKKTALLLDVDIIGLVIRGGHVASLVMLYEGYFLGKVSLGLNNDSRARLLTWGSARRMQQGPFSPPPAELRGEQILWLAEPFPCTVTGLEITSAGLLRHPKIAKLVIPL